MRTRRLGVDKGFTQLFEDFGVSADDCFECDMICEVRIEPGEKRTRDYPGSGPEVEILGVDIDVKSLHNRTLTVEQLLHAMEWCERDIPEADYERLRETFLEEADDDLEAAEDDYWDHRMRSEREEALCDG